MSLRILSSREPILLFVGDILVFIVSLWITLTLRHLSLPTNESLIAHLIPFSLLFVAWVTVFFVAGLYDKHTIIFKKKLPAVIFKSQLFNIVLAALFFFFIPYFGLTPKTNLVIYLVTSFVLILWWRLSLSSDLVSFVSKKKRQSAVLIGSGYESEMLFEEVNNNNRYPFYFILHIDPESVGDSLSIQATLIERVSSGDASIVVGDSSSPEFKSLVPIFSNLAFLNAPFRFIDIATMYENVFDRIPLSLIHPNWFLENVSISPKYIHDFLKRTMDIVLALILGSAVLLVTPFIYLAMKVEDGGPFLIRQERIGRDNKPISIRKFRSMSGDDKGSSVLKSKLTVTRVGSFLRKTRLDEFPQMWNVLKGDLSLIGTRPEFPALVKQYAERIPNYNIRHVVKPGLTGWAQINHHEHPHHGIDVKATEDKLSYDLYYIKNRSLMLDIHVALKTAKILLARAGR